MSLVAWYVVLGAVQVALALWVITTQPRRLLNWAVGAFLILWAGSGIMFQLWREAVLPADRQLFLVVGDIYEAPTFFLVLLILDRLVLPSRKPHAWTWFLAAMGGLVLVFWAGHLLASPTDQRLGLRLANACLNFASEIAATVLGALAANDQRRSILQRRQAAMLGLAFALLMAHAGAGSAQLLARGSSSFDPWSPLTVLGFAGLCASILAAFRLPAPFRGGARLAVAGSILTALTLGVLGAALSLRIPGGPTINAGRVAVLSAFSLVLAVGVLRYDLGAGRREDQRRMRRTAGLLLGLFVAALLGIAAWTLTGKGAFTLVLVATALLAPTALLLSPLKRLPAWLTRRILLHPNDPEALRERVRVYSTTLRAATGPDGRITPAAEPSLAALRAELGIGQRDHDLLMSMGGDQSAGGIVAYRLALVGAAANAEPMDEARLLALREELGLTQRDHALAMEHVNASADSLSVGALFLGRYHVLRRLAQGGSSEVWLAHDNRENVDVVLKHLAAHDLRDAAALKRIQQEVRAARLLEHPNIVGVRGVETVGDDMFLVMEFMTGGSLADVLRTRGRLPEEQVARLASDILEALVMLHGRGFVHRDVKPANILFDSVGSAKLGDFNVARELVSGDTVGEDGLRPPVGTFAYMALDQARGLAARPQHDLYGLAATMYEALSGRPLLDLTGLSHTEAIARIAKQGAPSKIQGISHGMMEVVTRALARSLSDGYPNATDMLEALMQVGTPAGFAQRR